MYTLKVLKIKIFRFQKERNNHEENSLFSLLLQSTSLIALSPADVPFSKDDYARSIHHVLPSYNAQDLHNRVTILHGVNNPQFHENFEALLRLLRIQRSAWIRSWESLSDEKKAYERLKFVASVMSFNGGYESLTAQVQKDRVQFQENLQEFETKRSEIESQKKEKRKEIEKLNRSIEKTNQEIGSLENQLGRAEEAYRREKSSYDQEAHRLENAGRQAQEIADKSYKQELSLYNSKIGVIRDKEVSSIRKQMHNFSGGKEAWLQEFIGKNFSQDTVEGSNTLWALGRVLLEVPGEMRFRLLLQLTQTGSCRHSLNHDFESILQGLLPTLSVPNQVAILTNFLWDESKNSQNVSPEFVQYAGYLYGYSDEARDLWYQHPLTKDISNVESRSEEQKDLERKINILSSLQREGRQRDLKTFLENQVASSQTQLAQLAQKIGETPSLTNKKELWGLFISHQVQGKLAKLAAFFAAKGILSLPEQDRNELLTSLLSRENLEWKDKTALLSEALRWMSFSEQQNLSIHLKRASLQELWGSVQEMVTPPMPGRKVISSSALPKKPSQADVFGIGLKLVAQKLLKEKDESEIKKLKKDIENLSADLKSLSHQFSKERGSIEQRERLKLDARLYKDDLKDLKQEIWNLALDGEPSKSSVWCETLAEVGVIHEDDFEKVYGKSLEFDPSQREKIWAAFARNPFPKMREAILKKARSSYESHPEEATTILSYFTEQYPHEKTTQEAIIDLNNMPSSVGSFLLGELESSLRDKTYFIGLLFEKAKAEFVGSDHEFIPLLEQSIKSNPGISWIIDKTLEVIEKRKDILVSLFDSLVSTNPKTEKVIEKVLDQVEKRGEKTGPLTWLQILVAENTNRADIVKTTLCVVAPNGSLLADFKPLFQMLVSKNPKVGGVIQQVLKEVEKGEEEESLAQLKTVIVQNQGDALMISGVLDLMTPERFSKQEVRKLFDLFVEQNSTQEAVIGKVFQMVGDPLFSSSGKYLDKVIEQNLNSDQIVEGGLDLLQSERISLEEKVSLYEKIRRYNASSFSLIKYGRSFRDNLQDEALKKQMNDALGSASARGWVAYLVSVFGYWKSAEEWVEGVWYPRK